MSQLRETSTSFNPQLARRTFLAGAAGLASAAVANTALARDYGENAAPVRYPEPDVVVLDNRFKKYKLGNTPIQRLYHSKDMLWAEGPAWNGVGRYLLWSDIPNDRQLRWLEEDSHVTVNFRNPAGHSNGNTFDFQGRQISCQHGPRCVVRYEYDGSVTVLADKYNGKDFNAPNDAVVHPADGAVWFTDPGYGGLMNYEGNRVKSDTPWQPNQKEAIYRLDVQTGKLTQVATDPFKPNGLCFSHDYKKLYVADTGKSHYDDAKEVIWVYDVVDGVKLGKGKVFTSMELKLTRAKEQIVNGVKTTNYAEETVAGFADGIRCDVDGNVWASAGWVGDGYDGVHIFAPEGTRIGQILLPEICSNVCFGGRRRNRLFMTASTSLYAVYVETQGAHVT